MNEPGMSRPEAKTFLQWRYGNEPAQVVYGDQWKGEEVTPSDIDALLDRVENGRFYFAPCTLRPSWNNTTPKPNDVIASSFVWFDFDAAKFGEKDAPPSDQSKLHYAKESERIANTLKAAWERLRIYPSAMWFSGGGTQGLFRLDREILPEHAEELSKKLATAIGADPAVWNRNRILRVPGGVNPKTEYGRQPTTSNVYFANDSVITVEALEAALAGVAVPDKNEILKDEIAIDWGLVPAQDIS